MSAIQLNSISFAYDSNNPLFKDFSLSLNAGERAGLMGPNGCGKTTLLLMLAGLITPQSGTISYFDSLVQNDEDFKAIRKKIGFLFQDPNDQLFCPTVQDDIAFGPLNLGLSHEAALARVNEICDFLDITKLKDKNTFKLSLGQKRMVALAGILAMQPSILLLDEPSANLEKETVNEISKYLKASDCTMIVASHDPYFLEDLSCKVISLA